MKKLVAIIGVALMFACVIIVGNNFMANASETKDLSKESIVEYYIDKQVSNDPGHEYDFVIESTDTDENGDEWIHGYLYKDGVLTNYAGINADWYYSQMMNARNS